MKNGKTARIILSALCAVCAVAAGLLAYNAVALGNLAEQKQASVDRIEAFLQSGKTEKFTNDEAIKKFEGVDVSKKGYDPKHSEYYMTAEGKWVDKKPKAVYKAPEGFWMRSFSDQWDEAKLKLLREELLKNKHGEEINYLFEVCVYPCGDFSFLATHNEEDKTTELKIDFPAITKFFSVKFHRKIGRICLYGGDDNTTVESMARSLSHEYGHQYTFYHMFDSPYLANTEYAKLRNLPKDKARNFATPADDYADYHEWYLFEIAAEDYVNLMGSPTVKRICEAKDNKQLLAGAEEPDFNEYSQCSNVNPQENLMIPLADDVKGLKEYFYSFIDEKPEIKTVKKEKIEINVEKGYKSYNFVDGKRSFKHYKVTWNTPYEDPDAVYTLIIFGDYKGRYFRYPVKTIHSGDNAVAYLGEVTRESGNRVYYYEDDITKGTQNLLVCVQLSDGTIILSDPLSYEFK